MSPSVRAGVLITLLIAANAGLLGRFTTAGTDQYVFKLCATKETIST